ncbi:MAG: DUF86 domain-containing protein [Promethearchaeota archaeon]
MRREIIKTKIREIEESVKLVKEHLPDNFEEFLNLGLVKDGIYKKIEFAIQNVFDISAIINTDLELGIPGSDEDIVENLARRRIIDERMKEKLKLMKGFRNIVVHKYGKIDDKLAFDILKSSMGDFQEFIEYINNFLADLK